MLIALAPGPALSNKHELLDRHVGFPISGVERALLSRGFAGEQDAGVLRRALRDHGSELQLSANPEPKDDPELVGGNPRAFQVQPERAPEGHALREAEKLR